MTENIRDISRAHWQRSEAAFMFARIGDNIFADSYAEVDDTTLSGLLTFPVDVVRDKLGVRASDSLTETELRAYQIASYLFREPDGIISRHTQFSHGISFPAAQYMFEGSYGGATREAMETEAAFPFNLAFGMAAFAKQEGIGGRQVDTLADVSALLRRHDYRKTLYDATVAPNGYWGTARTQKVLPGAIEPCMLAYDETTDSIVFGKKRLQDLWMELRAVNSSATSDLNTPVSSRASGGCPARHTRPQFTNSAHDQSRLKLLSDELGIPIEEILAPRQKNVIESGVDYLAMALERASKFQTQLSTPVV